MKAPTTKQTPDQLSREILRENGRFDRASFMSDRYAHLSGQLFKTSFDMPSQSGMALRDALAEIDEDGTFTDVSVNHAGMPACEVRWMHAKLDAIADAWTAVDWSVLK